MKKKMREWVRKTFPEKAERIIRYSLSEKRLEEAGVTPKKNEVFTQIWGFPDYWGSNYGRLVSYKYGRYKLRSPQVDPSGHIIYVMTNPCVLEDSEVVQDPTRKVISAQRIVGDCFLPNYWEGLLRRQLQVHHINRKRTDNRWTNLILLPAWLHRWTEYVSGFWLNNGKKFVRTNIYTILRKTNLSLDEIIFCLKREPELKTVQDGHSLEVYRIGDWYIGFSFHDPDFDFRAFIRSMGKNSKHRHNAQDED